MRAGPNPDLAIRPYPGGWRRDVALKDGVYVLRPILPADAMLYPEFFAHVEPRTCACASSAPRRAFTQTEALRLTQLDYDRDMAFVALTPAGELAGVSRLICDPDHRSAEYALIVRSDLKGRGLGRALLSLLIDYARADGLERLEGMVLADNPGMQALIGTLGFAIEHDSDDPGVVMTHLALW